MTATTPDTAAEAAVAVGVPWLAARSEPPETGVPAERVAEIMCEEFRELPFPPHPIALQPFLLPQPEYRQLLDAAAGLLALLRRSVELSGDGTAERLRELRLDPADCPYWTEDEQWELRHCADLARPDVVIGADGPKFVEFNVSGAFGGMLHFQLYQRAWQRIREAAGLPTFVAVDAYARLARLIEDTCRDLGTPPAVVLVGTPREWGPDTPLRHFRQQADLLRQHGIDAVHLDFEDLLDGIGVLDATGRPRYRLGIAQFDVHDAELLGYDISPVRAAQARGFRLIPSASSWLLHTKRQIALLSEGRPWMTAAERELADRYLPWTRLIGDREVVWQDGDHHLPTLLLQRREQFVIKGATGMSGQQVYFGARTDPVSWAALVTRAMASDNHVAQEVVPAVPMPVDVLEETGEIVRVVANPVISPFVVGGAGAGCFGRFVADRRPGIVSALSRARLTCLLGQA
ncbi:MAG: hypothetical protein AUG49_11705 [Catenulispora sp. 13_1_20CM_3_70_7]|jgi:hypothetical protein|nr:MAG: hypothetical protein AUG49_11705 [Catenulispora sp. 13_1_20CM_3_70_7]